ncbi:3-methyl-2-oxobutanoate hydroxymethyltransferase [Candidatus Sumerlaeota bacterium]|nr:3-methyl-2-oxobutanoate hydroxymethyltransferase [Candidatus Sumerlaeota bacterium]
MNGKKVRINVLIGAKAEGRRFACLTAYDYPTGLIVDQAGVELILVGDSLGNTVLGYEDTIPVTMEQMIHHAAAVRRGVKRALLVADMPFMSYKVSVEQALENCGRLVQEGGAEAVKLEGCREVAPMIEAVVAVGIPVLGHLGLTPQSVHALSGYRIQGREKEAAQQLKADARRLQEIGCFGVVLELVTPAVAAEITADLQIPTIGIGSGPSCDAQILVLADLLGLGNKKPPSFVKQYANLYEQSVKAIESYAGEVRDSKFPQ